MGDKKTSQELNQCYFESFVQTRGSVGMLNVAFAGLCIGLLEFVPIFFDTKDAYNINPWSSPVVIILFFNVIFMAFCFGISFLHTYIYKHQIFASVMLVGMSIVLTFELAFMFLMTVELPSGVCWGSVVNRAYIILVSVTYIISLVYNIIWLNRQLVSGFSEERAHKNYLASKIYESNSFGIIFGCTMTSAFLANIGMCIFSFASGLFLMVVFSRQNVEMSYAAYLRIKDKHYWEEIPEKQVRTREERRAARVKWLKRINIFSCFGILYFIGKHVEKYELTRWQIYIARAVIILIFLDLGTVMVLWIIKKIRKIWKEKKK